MITKSMHLIYQVEVWYDKILATVPSENPKIANDNVSEYKQGQSQLLRFTCSKIRKKSRIILIPPRFWFDKTFHPSWEYKIIKSQIFPVP